MVPLLQLNERDLRLVVSYSVESDEEMTEAVVGAFIEAGIDVFSESTTLMDWINPDVLENLEWNADQPLYLSTLIWDYRVVITAEEVRIYQSPSPDMSRNRLKEHQ